MSSEQDPRNETSWIVNGNRKHQNAETCDELSKRLTVLERLVGKSLAEYLGELPVERSRRRIGVSRHGWRC